MTGMAGQVWLSESALNLLSEWTNLWDQSKIVAVTQEIVNARSLENYTWTTGDNKKQELAI